MNENEFENVNPEAPETEEIVNEETISTEEPAVELEEVVADEIFESDAEEPQSEDVQEESETVTDREEFFADGETVAEAFIETPKKKSKALMIVLIVIIAIALIFGGFFLVFGSPLYNKLGLDKSEYGSFPDMMHCTFEQMTNKSSNKYNNLGYANPSGKTIEEISEELGVSLEEFLETYNLPADMSGDTEEMAAYYTMPVKVFAQMYGIDFATLKEAYSIPDETTPDIPTTLGDKIVSLFGGNKKTEAIDENTPWGKVMDEMTLATYVGEEQLEQFKEFYGITADITGETRYKEVRRAVEEAQMRMVAEAQSEENNAETEDNDIDIDNSSLTESETPNIEEEADTDENAETAE